MKKTQNWLIAILIIVGAFVWGKPTYSKNDLSNAVETYMKEHPTPMPPANYDLPMFVWNGGFNLGIDSVNPFYGYVNQRQFRKSIDSLGSLGSTVNLIAGTGISITGTYPNKTITNTAPYTAPTINTAVSRSLSNAAGSTNRYTISTTQNARVVYSINVVWNITALLSTASTVLLEYSTNSGSSWVIVSQVSKNVNLGLLQSGSDDLNVSGEIPANALVRIRPSVSTNSTITYTTGQEVLY